MGKQIWFKCRLEAIFGRNLIIVKTSRVMEMEHYLSTDELTVLSVRRHLSRDRFKSINMLRKYFRMSLDLKVKMLYNYHRDYFFCPISILLVIIRINRTVVVDTIKCRYIPIDNHNVNHLLRIHYMLDII